MASSLANRLAGTVGGPSQVVDRLGPGLGEVEVTSEEVDGVVSRPVERLTGLGQATMQLTALPADQAAVRHLDHEGVAERELILVIVHRAVEELRFDELLDRAVQVGDLLRHALEQREVDPPSDDRRPSGAPGPPTAGSMSMRPDRTSSTVGGIVDASHPARIRHPPGAGGRGRLARSAIGRAPPRRTGCRPARSAASVEQLRGGAPPRQARPAPAVSEASSRRKATAT